MLRDTVTDSSQARYRVDEPAPAKADEPPGAGGGSIATRRCRSLRRPQLHGFAGDTLASALLADGVRLVGRSFKYHRPRGIITAGVEEPNALSILNGLAGERPEPARHRFELYDVCGRDPELLAGSASIGAVDRLPRAVRLRASTTRPSCGRLWWRSVYERD